MTQSEITDVELEWISKGVQRDTHFQEDCDPQIVTGTYFRDNQIVSSVQCHFRYCKCGRYNKAACDKVLENFWRTSVPLPTDGIFIHRPACRYDLMKVKSHCKIGDQQLDVYTYVYKCICRYTLNPSTAFHDSTDRRELLVVHKR